MEPCGESQLKKPAAWGGGRGTPPMELHAWTCCDPSVAGP